MRLTPHVGYTVISDRVAFWPLGAKNFEAPILKPGIFGSTRADVAILGYLNKWPRQGDDA